MQVQFVVFKIFTNAIYTKLHKKSCCYLLIIYMKNITEFKMDKILAACTCFMENALVFSQSDVHNFFMYIIRKCMYDLN